MKSKSFYIFAIALICCSTANGQVKIQNTSLISPDTNLVYVGVDNILQITGTKNLDRLKISINDTEQKFKKNGLFVLRSASEASTFKIKLSSRSKILVEKVFNSRKILNPKIGLGARSLADTTLSIQEILANNKLLIHIPDCLYHFYMQVVRFDLTIYSGNKIINSISVKGNRLSHVELDLLKNLKSGDKIAFENIRATGPEDTRVKNFFIIIVK